VRLVGVVKEEWRNGGREGGRGGVRMPLLGEGGLGEEGGGGGGGGGGEGERRSGDDAYGSTTTPSPPPPRSSLPPSSQKKPHWVLSLLLTYLLVLLILSIAIQVDSVATIWAVLGSFACFAVSFILPPLAYLKVGCPQQRVKRIWAWVVCVVGVVMMVACTIQTIGDLMG
jgi:hypothetical protein